MKNNIQITFEESILIVDDSPENLHMLKSILEKKGYKVRVAPGGVHALTSIQKEIPDLILLDIIMMPGMNGYEVCRKLKQDDSTRDVPIIFVTSMGEVKDEWKGLKLGAVDYIRKPFSPPIVLARVRTHLDLQIAYRTQKVLLDKTMAGITTLLTDIIDLTYPEILKRSKRISTYINKIVKFLNPSDPWTYKLAGLLSQIGCISLSPKMLEKTYSGSQLSKEEQKMFKNHPNIGRDLIMKIPLLHRVADMIYLQNFPASATKLLQPIDEVRIGGDILKVVLDFDREVSSGISPDEVILHMFNDTKQYNTKVVNVLQHTVIKKVPKITVKSKLISRISDLSAGMTLDEDIKTKKGTLLLSKGCSLSEPAIKRLEYYVNMGNIEKKFRIIDD